MAFVLCREVTGESGRFLLLAVKCFGGVAYFKFMGNRYIRGFISQVRLSKKCGVLFHNASVLFSGAWEGKLTSVKRWLVDK